jgi:cytochrome P450
MFIAILSFVLILCWVLRAELRKLQLAWNYPGPRAIPLVGNGLDLINKTPIELIQVLNRYLKNHGSIFRIWLGNQLLIATTNPKTVQAIMTDNNLLTKAMEYKFLEPWLGTGLLTSTNQKWLTRRKILTPAFHFKILDEFVEVFDKQGTILIEKLRKFDGKESFNVFPLVALCALDVICGNYHNQGVKNVNILFKGFI